MNRTNCVWSGASLFRVSSSIKMTEYIAAKVGDAAVEFMKR